MTFRSSARGRATRVVLALGLATALTVTVGGPAGGTGADGAVGEGWAAPDWSYSPDEPIADGDIDARAAGEAITREEAERRLRADRAASHLQDVARSRWPETFAGLWVDHAPYRVTVAFTRDAAEHLDALRAEFPYPDDVRVVDAAYSLLDLSALQGRLATDRGSLQQGRDVPGMPDAIRTTGGVYDLDVDIRTGHVVVRAARVTPALRAAFRQQYLGPVVVRQGLAKPSACTQADCRHAMLSGLQLVIPGSSTYCSSAFPAYHTSSPSTRYVLSAGHCYLDSRILQRHNGGELYGSVTQSTMAYEVDAERVLRADGTPWRESSKFVVQPEANPRMVSSVTTYSSLVVGAYLGKTGFTTGTTRGYVTSKSSAPSYVPNARNFVAADMCSFGGDSGAGVWSGNSAYGIVSGALSFSRCRDINGTLGTTLSSQGGTTIFGALSYATAALGVTVLTGVNLRPSAEFTSSCLLLSCSFNASASKDDDGGITSYAWNFGDGNTGTGMTTSHRYSLPGFYTVSLTTKDNNGATTSKSVGITVTSSP